MDWFVFGFFVIFNQIIFENFQRIPDRIVIRWSSGSSMISIYNFTSINIEIQSSIHKYAKENRIFKFWAEIRKFSFGKPNFKIARVDRVWRYRTRAFCARNKEILKSSLIDRALKIFFMTIVQSIKIEKIVFTCKCHHFQIEHDRGNVLVHESRLGKIKIFLKVGENRSISYSNKKNNLKKKFFFF